MNSKIILCNDDDNGYGYIISESDENGLIYVMFWWNTEKNRKQVVFNSRDHFYEKSKIYLDSLLTNFNHMHISYTKMCKDYVNWYDSINKIEK